MLENTCASDGLELATSGVTGDQRVKQRQPPFECRSPRGRQKQATIWFRRRQQLPVCCGREP